MSNQDLILRYLKDELNKEERAAFEHQLKEDRFLRADLCYFSRHLLNEFSQNFTKDNPTFSSKSVFMLSSSYQQMLLFFVVLATLFVLGIVFLS